MNNFSYAARTLRKNRAFSLTVVVVLALGIGGNVAIFSIVNAALLRPLPYEDPARLVMLFGNVQRTVVERRGASRPDYNDWKEQSRSFEGLSSVWNRSFALRGAAERVPVDGEIVGAQYLRLLGVKPILGRDFRTEEETDSALPPVVIISHEIWGEHFGSDPAIAGRPLTLNATNYTILGVAPEGFRGVRDRAQLWIPSASLPPPERSFEPRGERGLEVLGRLRNGISLAQAQAEMNGIARALEQAYPLENDKRGVEVAALVKETLGPLQPALTVLLGAVSLVLLISCANVANLMLLRTEARQAEMAIRTAVGAPRRELLKLVAAETLLLSFAGAAVGLLVSGWVVDLVLAISPVRFPSFVDVTLDGNVILFAAALACFTSALMAIAPAIQVSPSSLQETLTSATARMTGAARAKRFRNGLVIAEVALSFTLLLTAGLLLESFRQLLRVDTGFDASNMLTLRLGFDNPSSARAIEVRDALAALPGVKSVALSSVIPFRGGGAIFYSAEGEQPPLDATAAPRAYLNFVTPGFFQTMRIPLRHGRDFSALEGNESVIVSEKLVQRFWPAEDPIGKRIRIGRNNPDNPWLNIVGVVGNTKTRGIPDNPTPDPDIYFAFGVFGGNPAVLIRTDAEPSYLVAAVLNEIRRMDRMALVTNVATVEELMRPGTSLPRSLGALSGIFAGIALVLALVGIYGSMSYTVAQRVREIGVRIALGAARKHLLRMVLGHSLALIGLGIGLGVIGSLFAGRAISKLLFGIGATDPIVFLSASLLTILTGLGAAYLPARRAARIDPLHALRQE
jgi:putative ABC transport system permease protein